MAQTLIPIFNADGQSAYISYETESTTGYGRQTVTIGNASAKASVASVQSTDPSSNVQGLVVRDVNTSAIASYLAGTLGVYLAQTAGTLQVKLDPSSKIAGVDSSVSVYVSGTAGTLNVALKPGTIAVQLDPGHTLGSISGIGSSIAAHILSTGGTLQVKIDPSSKIAGIDSSINVHLLSTGGTQAVKLDPSSKISGIDSTIGVNAKLMDFVNTASTASIFTISGSASGVSASGNTILAPSASYNFKVFAFSLQTTGIVSTVARFTNGAGSATELWRGLVTSNQTSSTPIGANLAVQPPGFLFQTGTNTTLALHLDNASLVHYSVSLIKESA